jgi:hypothetical protein
MASKSKPHPASCTRRARARKRFIIVAAAYLSAFALIIGAGLLADHIPGWGWVMVGIAVLTGGVAILAGDGSR